MKNWIADNNNSNNTIFLISFNSKLNYLTARAHIRGGAKRLGPSRNEKSKIKLTDVGCFEM